MERKRSQEKRSLELEETKRRDKERSAKEEPPIVKRSEKEVKKIVEVTRKIDVSVSPKKLQPSSMPISRHRVISHIF